MHFTHTQIAHFVLINPSMYKKIIFVLNAVILTYAAFAQPTHVITDVEKQYKTAKTFILKEQYAFAYSIVKELKKHNNQQTKSDNAYLYDDVNYYNALCELKLLQPIGKIDAIEFINSVNNEPLRQLMSFNLGHFCFLQNEFQNAITYFNEAGFDNLSNDQIADAKFEKAYALFNLSRFEEAKPLFNEIHQLPTGKYFIPANYYYGFIAYYEKQYFEALKAFKLVETIEEYKAVVPYYIAEIYYAQGKKDDALLYGETILKRNTVLYYDKQLRLLIGQIYYENKQYSNALPLLQSYVSSTDKVPKEILYELSYCYYIEGNNTKAIEGFKQLSSLTDSMGQNSMYLLGSLYIKTNNKANARTAFQYSAYNNSNPLQQQIAQFNYAKLSYELGYQNVALNEIKAYLKKYPSSTNDAEAKEILVSLLAGTNNYDDALNVYNSLENPTTPMQKLYPAILYGKAIGYVNDLQLQKADDLFTKIISIASNSTIATYANFWRGEIAFRMQQYNNAIGFLNTFLKGNVPSQGEANITTAKYNLGYSAFKLENYNQAIQYFEQVVKQLTPSSTPLEQDAYLRMADAYYIQKDYTKAQQLYDAALQANTLQADYAYYQKAMILGIKSSTEKIQLLNKLNKLYPSSSLQQEANMEIALTLIADEKFTDAIGYLNKIIQSNDGGLKPRAYLKLGLAHYNSTNNTAALNAYTQLLQTYPQSREADEAVDIVKSIYVDDGKPEEYISLMQKIGRQVTATESDSLSYDAAFAKYSANNCTAAQTAFTNYINKNPQGAFVIDAYFLRSECYKKSNEIANAIAGYTFVSAKGSNKYFEKATLYAAQLNYFETKNYLEAKKYFSILSTNAANQDNQLEALRGLVRSLYQLKDYAGANVTSKALLARKGISTDDKSIGYLVLGKNAQAQSDCAAAITAFKQVAAINKSAWGAEARYEIANCYLFQNNYSMAEKAALATIKETGSYDQWVTKSYILLGDIFMAQKDYFNAKATYQSIIKNASIIDLKIEAQEKFEKATEAEKLQSNLSN